MRTIPLHTFREPDNREDPKPPDLMERIARERARVEREEGKLPQRTREQWLEAAVEDLPDIDPRTACYLEEGGIFTVGDLLSRTPTDLLMLRQIGPKKLSEVFDALERAGFPRERKAA